MGIIRNHIDVVGITPEDQLPKKIQNGQVIEYSEVENIFIPRSNSNIKSIYQIVLDVKVTAKRNVNIPIGNIVIIDGFKKIKIIYCDKGRYQKANVLDLKLPYNTFVEMPEGKEVGSVYIKIIDAYFDLIEGRKLYSHIVYLVEVNYKTDSFIEDNYEKEKLNEDIIKEVGICDERINNNQDKFKPLVNIDAEFL
ncbi:hypothetical protein RBU49_17760 [Clostridium sp. MB40-C1]|uniref:hypothetical protein n=1 Tax=Clostridium sp. MB40-C1 TaxID=3070996 RepID=UPI0027DF9C36|nr:hypothetical protein [Clostridium sp. MB40-C1]WMJ80625.1 hypothetical protein RBU49_17760 [Clostridium sp. MB40-C1]